MEEPTRRSDPEKSSELQWTKREKYVAGLSVTIGFVVGVLIFAVTFGRLFSQSLVEWEIRHNLTLVALQDRLDLSTQEKEACLNDDRHALEVAELRGKLAARSTLMQRHEKLQEFFDERGHRVQELMQQHDTFQAELEAGGRRVEELVDEIREREQAYLELKGIIDQQTKELENNANACDEVAKRADRLSEQRDALTRQVKNLSSQLHEAETQLGEYTLQTGRYQHRIRQRESFLCKELYGMGPYYVQISAKVRGMEDSSAFVFVVELASRRDMPHSVFTFLSLVNYEMYDAATFHAPVKESAILSLSMPMDAEVTFQEKRRMVGMEEYILMFSETSSQFPCEEYSVGFQGMGPALELYLSLSPEGDESSSSCFGKIVRGGETLESIHKSLSNGEVVDITHSQLLVV